MSNYEELNRIYGEAETEFIYDSFSIPHTANAPGKDISLPSMTSHMLRNNNSTTTTTKQPKITVLEESFK
jgi:hypothetical protein